MKKLSILFLSICAALALVGYSREMDTNHGVAPVSSSANSAASSEVQSSTPQFSQSIVCSGLSFDGVDAPELEVEIDRAMIVQDFHTFPAENFKDDIAAQIAGWITLPASLLPMADEDAQIRLLCVTQTITNNSAQEVTFSANARLIALDSATGEELEAVSGDLASEPLYIDASGKNDMTEAASGIRPHQFQITLAAGESVKITTGFAVSGKLLEMPLLYWVNPFGREDAAAGRVVMGYVE